MKKFKIAPILLFLISSTILVGQKNIFEKLAIADSATNATVKIYQDKRIEKFFSEEKVPSPVSVQTSTANGFKVQVFSSNVQRSAKAEAFKIEKQIKEVFPEQAVYVTYTSPFWKVRVGDFRTNYEAQAWRQKINDAFPEMRSGVYIVRDQIIITSSR